MKNSLKNKLAFPIMLTSSILLKFALLQTIIENHIKSFKIIENH